MAEGQLQEIGTAEFEDEVINAQGKVVVDFWAPWCGPCKMVAPVLEKLAGAHGDKVRVVKVNVDENQELAGRYGIMSIPTVILFENGQVAAQIIGARSQQDYEREFGLS
ncbi:MAG: thioredoxin [Thermoleophilia bacterium]